MTKELLKKIENGDGITDQELVCAIDWFYDLEQKLKMLGERFRLAWLPIFATTARLNGFKEERIKRESSIR